ncbi:hypothetical protein QZH41_003967 [Actinostola sp. cb2023]|nr:hypothetical protein QZH41_003967 [Actinostola sp. cb2023]
MRCNRNICKKEEIWRKRMFYYAGPILQIKPLVKQSSIDHEEQTYNGLRNPFVIVINNVKFTGNPLPRNGADTDEENLTKLLRQANFNAVEFFHNLNKKEMWDVFERKRKDPELGR